MKRLVLIFTLAVLLGAPAAAQKLVVGSKATQFKPDRDLEWSGRIAPEQKVWLIDFYSTKNPSCVKFYSLLPGISKKAADRFAIVLICRGQDNDFKRLSATDQDLYYFAYDLQGDVYSAFGVQYLPFSVLVDSEGQILWQGNLSALSDEVIEKIK